MKEPDGKDYLLSVIYENLDVLNVDPLEVNRPNPNHIVLSDSYGFGEGSIESSGVPLSAYTKGSIDEFSEEDG